MAFGQLIHEKRQKKRNVIFLFRTINPEDPSRNRLIISQATKEEDQELTGGDDSVWFLDRRQLPDLLQRRCCLNPPPERP